MIKIKDPKLLFEIRSKLTYANEDDPLSKRLIINAIERASGRQKLEKLYDEVRAMNIAPIEVWETILQKLNIHIQYDKAQLARVPVDHPVVFIANHPFGVVDGLILGYLVSKVRKKFAILVNEVLCREPLFDPFFLPIDFRETKEATQTNIDTRKKTMARLKAGEALAIFPAGGVATSPQFWAKPEDLEWKRFVTKIIQVTQATVIPVFVHGRNSRLFQVASQVSLSLRLSLLLREAKNKIGTQIQVSVGDPISYAELSEIKDRQVLLDFLRSKTFELANNQANSKPQKSRKKKP